MGWMLLVVVAVVAAAMILTTLARNTSRTAADAVAWSLTPKPVMNGTEKRFFWRLQEALPDHVILAQVALSQLVRQGGLHDPRVWNKIDRKVIDFLVCDSELRVIAAIEIDGPTHTGKTQRQRDADKNAALNAAGYRLLRISTDRLPSGDEIRSLVLQQAHGAAVRPPAIDKPTPSEPETLGCDTTADEPLRPLPSSSSDRLKSNQPLAR
jgi:very-short-patch-repair endonuclease